MSNKYFDGVVSDMGVISEVDEDLKTAVCSAADRVHDKMENLRVADAMTEIFNLFRRCNKYIDETQPWVLAKEESDRERLSTVLYNLVEGIVIGASLLEPFMPKTAERVAEQLCTSLRGFDSLKEFGKYPSGNKVTEKPEILFARLDVKEVVEKADAMFAERKAAAESKVDEKDAETKQAADENKGETGQEEGIDIEAKPEIEYGDFDKLQFQVGEIIACEAVKKSKKLLCSQVKIGNQVKQILSGIKQYYSPEEMVGKRVMVLVNLKPATMAGIVSEGMLLCAEDADGNLSLVSPEKEMPSGAVIC